MQRTKLVLTIPSLTSAGENQTLGAENLFFEEETETLQRSVPPSASCIDHIFPKCLCCDMQGEILLLKDKICKIFLTVGNLILWAFLRGWEFRAVPVRGLQVCVFCAVFQHKSVSAEGASS